MTTTDPRPAIGSSATTTSTPAGSDSLSGHNENDAPGPFAAEGQPSPQAIAAAIPTIGSPAGSNTSHGQSPLDSHPSRAVAAYVPGGQVPAGNHVTSAAGDSGAGQPAAQERPAPKIEPLLADPLLALAADVLDDLEKVRLANENRLRQLTRSEEDSDGETRGFGLSEAHPDVARLAALVDMLAKTEHQAELNLGRLVRKHPLGPWVKATAGIGEKQGPRLLAAIGDPYIRPEITRQDGTVEPSRPRLVSELWAYAGYHVIKAPVSGQVESDAHLTTAADGSEFPADHRLSDPQVAAVGGDQASHPGQVVADAQDACAGVAPKRQRGQVANWSATAKMRAYLVAVSCMKCMDSPYRAVYDATRAKYADAVHQVPCVRCGPAGKPAQPGTPLSDGHKHARALRAVAKEVLRDLWREARRIHTETPVSGQLTLGSQAAGAADGPELPGGQSTPGTLSPRAAGTTSQDQDGAA